MRRAFTLIEIMVVIAIMGILATAGSSIGIQSIRARQLEQGTSKIETVLNTARGYALAGQKVNCTSSLTSWDVYVSSSTTYELRENCSGGPFVHETGVMPGAVNLGPVGATVAFKPLGQGVGAPVDLVVNGYGSVQVITTAANGMISAGTVGTGPTPTPMVFPTNTPAPTATPTLVPTATPVPPSYTAFVTVSFGSGNIGGLNNANSRCQNEANTYGLSGTYRAWLSTDTVSALTNIQPANQSARYVKVNGVEIASNFSDLTDGTIGSALNVRANGASVNTGRPYTGSTAAGLNTGGNCNNWTTASLFTLATFGGYGSTNGGWSQSLNASCSTNASIFCFQVN